MHFFKTQGMNTPGTLTTATDIIINAQKLLADKDRDNFVLPLLEARISDFNTALNSDTLSTADKNDIIIQYNRFAKTLASCIDRPKEAYNHINRYHNKLPYYPIGIPEDTTPNPTKRYFSIAGTVLGASLIIAALSLLTVNPLIGLIMLPVGITLLAPCVFALFTPNPIDPTVKKEEEKTLFERAAIVMSPDRTVEEQDNDNYSHYPYAYSTL